MLRAGELAQAGRTLVTVSALVPQPPDPPVDRRGRRRSTVRRASNGHSSPRRGRSPRHPATRALATAARRFADPAPPRRRSLSRHEAADDAPVLAPLTGDGSLDLHRGPAQRPQGVREALPRVPAASGRAPGRARGRAGQRGPSATSAGTLPRRASAARPYARSGALGAAGRRQGLPRIAGGSADLPSLLSVRLDPAGARACAARPSSCRAGTRLSPRAGHRVAYGARRHALCGTAGARGSLARSLVAQAAALHSPADLAIAAAIPPDRVDAWDWLKWLPHCDPDTRPGSAPRRRTCRLAALLEELSRLVAARRADSESAYGGAARRGQPHVLLVLDEGVAPERAFVRDILADGGEHGVSCSGWGASGAICRAKRVASSSSSPTRLR